jgi:hypothetical protein
MDQIHNNNSFKINKMEKVHILMIVSKNYKLVVKIHHKIQ